MPRFYPDIMISDCLGSLGDKTFYHRDGPLLLSRQVLNRLFPETDGQLDWCAPSSCPGSLDVSRNVGIQRIWNEYALTVPSSRLPYDPRQAYPATTVRIRLPRLRAIGNEHVPVPQRKGHFLSLRLTSWSATVVNDVNLLLQFQLHLQPGTQTAIATAIF
jgi:hypothetical protein